MKIVLVLLLLASGCWAQSASDTIYEVDGTSQTSRPITFGQVFKQAEITDYPQVKVGGSTLSAGNWQENVKNRWGDGSVRFAIISFIAPTFSANASLAITFQNSVAGSHTGQLTQAQMTGFNSGNWNAQLVVASNGSTTVTKDFKTMLGLSDPGAGTFGDCLNDYWLTGPVVTAAIVQDCTSASASDFGWTWNGSAMSSPVTGNSSTASLHPWAILYFYPSTNTVQARMILENDWTGRAQDQSYTLTIKTGSGPSTVYGPTALTQIWGTRFPKTYWSGTAPGHIRIDHNIAYLISSKIFPSYDQTVSVSTATNDANNYATSFATWTGGSDHGDLGQFGGVYAIVNSFDANGEGAPLQREELLYLYNMTTCGTVNGECAKAWDMLTGEVDANASNTLVGYSGGAGVWNNFGNIPYHARESRTTGSGVQTGSNWFYCSGFADKNSAGNNTTCGSGTGVATGRPMSRHAHSDGTMATASPTVSPVGTISAGTWQLGRSDHWQDWSYVPYLLTGDYFELEETYTSASWGNNNVNDGNAPYQSNGIFAFSNSLYWIMRNYAWALQGSGRAALLAPDGTVEQTYYAAMRDSNIEVQEGVMNITGTALTPSTSQNSFGSGSFTYNNSTANRWDWGRYAVYSQCITGTCNPIVSQLHSMEIGNCPINSEAPPTVLDTAVTASEVKPWMENYAGVVLGLLQDSGATTASPLATALQQRIIEQILDSNFNPFLLASYTFPSMNTAGSSCSSNVPSGTIISTYATLKAGWTSDYTNLATFNHGASPPLNPWQPCADHGYSLVARAATTFAATNSVTSTDASCPGGTCQASTAWTWASGHIPFFNVAVTASNTCASTGSTDQQIKYALTPRTPTPPPSGTGSTLHGSTFKGSIITLMLTHQPFHARLSLASE